MTTPEAGRRAMLACEHGPIVNVVGSGGLARADVACVPCIDAAIAQARAEERERAFEIIGRLGMEWHNALPDDRPALMDGLNQVAAALRRTPTGGRDEQ